MATVKVPKAPVKQVEEAAETVKIVKEIDGPLVQETVRTEGMSPLLVGGLVGGTAIASVAGTGYYLKNEEGKKKMRTKTATKGLDKLDDIFLKGEEMSKALGSNPKLANDPAFTKQMNDLLEQSFQKTKALYHESKGNPDIFVSRLEQMAGQRMPENMRNDFYKNFNNPEVREAFQATSFETAEKIKSGTAGRSISSSSSSSSSSKSKLNPLVIGGIAGGTALTAGGVGYAVHQNNKKSMSKTSGLVMEPKLANALLGLVLADDAVLLKEANIGLALKNIFRPSSQPLKATMGDSSQLLKTRVMSPDEVVQANKGVKKQRKVTAQQKAEAKQLATDFKQSPFYQNPLNRAQGMPKLTPEPIKLKKTKNGFTKSVNTEAAPEQLQEARGALSQFIADKPLTSVGLAGATGLGAGSLFLNKEGKLWAKAVGSGEQVAKNYQSSVGMSNIKKTVTADDVAAAYQKSTQAQPLQKVKKKRTKKAKPEEPQAKAEEPKVEPKPAGSEQLQEARSALSQFIADKPLTSIGIVGASGAAGGALLS